MPMRLLDCKTLLHSPLSRGNHQFQPNFANSILSLNALSTVDLLSTETLLASHHEDEIALDHEAIDRSLKS